VSVLGCKEERKFFLIASTANEKMWWTDLNSLVL